MSARVTGTCATVLAGKNEADFLRYVEKPTRNLTPLPPLQN